MALPQIHIGPETPYLDVLAQQERAVAEVVAGTGPERVFFVEHAPVYTAGSSADGADWLGATLHDLKDIPVVTTGRGGKMTYHGPGQRVLYPILNLNERGRDLRAYICALQKVVQLTLADFGLASHCRDEVGVWVDTPRGPEKIAAIGVRVRKWISFHGVALNVMPNMRHFQGIVPCGLRGLGVTSMASLGVNAPMSDVDARLTQHLNAVFPTFSSTS